MLEPQERQPTGGAFKRFRVWSKVGLQARMTLSYVWVTVVSLLLLTGLAITLLAVVITGGVLPAEANDALKPLVVQQAQVYALETSLQASGSALNPQTTFQPGHPETLLPPHGSNALTIPYMNTGTGGASPSAFALLIAPTAEIVASSAPGHYLPNAPVSTLLPQRLPAITNALAGRAGSGIDNLTTLGVIYAVEPVWSQKHTTLGAIYVQAPIRSLHASLVMLLDSWAFVGIVFLCGFLLLAAPLLGGLFGTLTTRGLVRRVQRLEAATAQVAAGKYTERVSVWRRDEIGRLEAHFNQMAAQLAESLSARQELAAQHARLAERARISRELHDTISQEVFSLRMLADGLQAALPADSVLQPQMSALEQTTSSIAREMQALLLEMRPLQLEDQGLAEALEALAGLYRTRLGLKVMTSITPVRLPPQAEHTLLRIAQEALTNAVRHGQAATITLHLHQQRHTIAFTITDDGQGFDPAAQGRAHGFGLRLMQERVRELHGTFEIRSGPGQGTSVSIGLPQEESDDSRCDCR
jgi:signal transduction histidine kinase